MKAQTQRFYKNRIKKQERTERKKKVIQLQLVKQKQEEQSKGSQVAIHLYQTIENFFPHLFAELSSIGDPRKKESKHNITAIVGAALLMFLFKQESRNDFNALCSEAKFQKNVLRIFKLKLPHMDSVERVFRLLDSQILECVKAKLIHILLEKKVFHPFRHFNHYFQVVYDATGVVSFDHKHCDCCTHKTAGSGNFILSSACLESLKTAGIPLVILEKLSQLDNLKVRGKSVFSEKVMTVLSAQEWREYGELLIEHTGKTTWFHNVLEAKLVTSNGFSVSLGSEWIANANTEYEKQDCERKAFVRLAEKVKKEFPQLPTIAVADGLYPHQGFFQICKDYQWECVVVFKDGNLPSMWKKVKEEFDKAKQKNSADKNQKQDYWYINNLQYHSFNLNWAQCIETTFQTENKKEEKGRFVFLTSFQLDNSNIEKIVKIGRLRQKIENEAFNIQKNHGYHLQHKFSRVSFNAMQNYYQCLQIAHLINQLMELSNRFKSFVESSKKTLKFLWKCLFAFFIAEEMESEILHSSKKRVQFRYL